MLGRYQRGTTEKDSEIILGAINKNVNEVQSHHQTYLCVENRKEALRDADFVVNAIQVGGYDPCTITDFEILKIRSASDHRRYTGIGGIMRALLAPSRSKNLPEIWKKSARSPPVSELHQPDGDADWLYAEIQRSVP